MDNLPSFDFLQSFQITVDTGILFYPSKIEIIQERTEGAIAGFPKQGKEKKARRSLPVLCKIQIRYRHMLFVSFQPY